MKERLKYLCAGMLICMLACIASAQLRVDVAAASLVEQANALLDNSTVGDGSIAEAEAKLQEALSLDPNNAAAYVALSRAKLDAAYISNKEYDPAGLVAANAAATKAIAIAPDSPEGYLQQAAVLRLEKRLPQAAAAIEAARQRGAHGPLLELREAQLLGSNGKSAAAQEKFQHLARDPAVPLPIRLSALQNLSSMFREQRQIPQADAVMKQLAELSPGDAWMIGNYGTFLRIWMLRVDESEQWLRRARAVRDNPVARENLGFTLYLQWAAALHRKDAKLAQKYFDEASKLVADPRELLPEISLYPHGHPIVEALHAKGYSLDRYADATDGSDTPLTDAARAGNAEIVSQLIAAGVDVNRSGSDGSPPLLHAVLGGSTPIVQDLLAHGADPWATNVAGVDGEALARQAGHVEIATAIAAAKAKKPRAAAVAEMRNPSAPFRVGNVYRVKKKIKDNGWMGSDIEAGEELIYQSPANYTDPALAGFQFSLADGKGHREWAVEREKVATWSDLFEELGPRSTVH